jgi:hypothetical protein
MDRDCDSCKKQKTMECPNSSECYALESKPYWEKHAFKQAKAESLVRELNVQKRADKALTKAKEVLDDEV